jgi:hypothetical protein
MHTQSLAAHNAVRSERVKCERAAG